MIKILFFTLLILLGILMFVYAEIDDSPGGQLLGLILIIISVFKIIRYLKK